MTNDKGKILRGKDLQPGMVLGNRKVVEVCIRGRKVVYSYEYRVVGDNGKVRWYHQGILPVASIACNAKLPEQD